MIAESVPLWIQRAESDLKTGLDESQSTNPAVATVCYLMQQAAEKYLKAYLAFHGATPPKTHNLDVILNS